MLGYKHLAGWLAGVKGFCLGGDTHWVRLFATIVYHAYNHQNTVDKSYFFVQKSLAVPVEIISIGFRSTLQSDDQTSTIL